MKIKLIYFTTDPEVGGGPKHIYHLLEGVDKGFFECSLVAPGGWLSDEVKSQKSKVNVRLSSHCPAIGSEAFAQARRERSRMGKIASQNSKIKSYQTRNTGSVFDKVAELRSILRKIKAEGYPFSPVILHAHSPESLFLASRAVSGLGIHLVYTDHLWTKDYHTQSWIRDQIQFFGIRQALRSTSKVIAVSKAVADFLVKKRLTKKEKIVIIPPVVWELPKYHPAKKSHPKGPMAEKMIIGSIGALNRVKDYGSLIEAVYLLMSKDLKFTVEIIGDGLEKANLEALISQYKLKSVVKLLGDIPSEELAKHYQNWDIYTQPSSSETFGLCVLKAMYFGLPVVASRAGALPELVENGQTGILIQVSNPKSLAKGLEELLTDDRLREKFGHDGQKKVQEEKFNGQKNIKKIEELYRKIIS